MLKGVIVNLSGTDYEVPPLTLGQLERLQDRLAKAAPGSLDPGTIGTIIEAAHGALLRNYPDMTRERLAEIIDVGNMVEVFQAVMDISGLKRKEQEAEKQGAKTD